MWLWTSRWSSITWVKACFRLEKLHRIIFQHRMNHHRPGENFSFDIFFHLCVHRVLVSSKLVSQVTKCPNAFSRISKYSLDDLSPEESDDITQKSFSFCFQLFFINFAMFFSVWADRSMFGLWLERWRAIYLWGQKLRIIGVCWAFVIRWSTELLTTGTIWKESGHISTAK